MGDQSPRALIWWPGLAGLWLRGNWSSLLVAVGFSLILNLALVMTFVWPAMPGANLKIVIWPTLLLIWLMGVWFSSRLVKQCQKAAETPDESDDTLFIQAQTEYLRGDFTQAELLLVKQLQSNSRDAEARLLLAAVYRRTQREEKAIRQLDNLQRLDTGVRWRFEIEQERQRIDRQTSDLDADDSLQNEDPSGLSPTATIRLGETSEKRHDATTHKDEQDTTVWKRTA